MRKVNLLIKSNIYNKQQGIALLILLLVLGSGALYGLLRTLNQNNLQIERDRKTTEVLAMAKEALIGYAVSVNLQPGAPNRPGNLPCPDTNNDGKDDKPCGDEAGSNQVLRLGRLPWKTLGLAELFDGYGEHLWYAVSNNFKESSRKEPLNSVTTGTITVRNSGGVIIHNGTDITGAIAVVISVGPIVSRQGVLQVRAGAGMDNPINYLDISSMEDNANFVDNALNGFIQGSTTNVSINTTVNDNISVLSYNDLMPLINKRVIGEVNKCNGSGPCAISKTSTSGWWVKNNWQSFYRLP